MYKKISSSLLLQIATIFLLTSAFLGLSIIGIQRGLLLDYLKEQALEQHTIVGRSISENLNNKLKTAETLAAALANVSRVLPKEPETFKTILPALIDDTNAKDYIAGGGIWPEPGKFSQGVDRRSFFWGRNKDGLLEYYEDYNDPKGSGYHHEEWYVPARYMTDDRCYWSKSYVDPYSFQPMVTCTVSIREKGEFIGVSTIDLKLEGLSDILSQNMQSLGGYAFALDRNNKFLAFPEEEKVHRGEQGATEVERREYIDTAAMVKRAPDFVELAQALDDALASLPKGTTQPNQLAFSQEALAKLLDEDSYQVNKEEAYRIAKFLTEKSVGAAASYIQSRHIRLEHDMLLKQPAYATIFFLPKTDWKLVLVTPTSQVLGTANKISWLVGFISVAVICLILVGFFLILKRVLMSPLQDIIRRLRSSNTGGRFDLLDEKRDNELGQIARWYNLRTQQLIDTKNEAERANNAKSEFLANMSHELRTPLNSILGLSDLLKGEPLEKEQKETVFVIHKSANNLLSIVNDILDLSKIEEGQFNLEIVPFRIHDVASNVLDALSPIASRKGLCLSLFFKNENYPTVMGDPLRVERILTNLIGNALKYTLKGKVDINIYCEPQAHDEVIIWCDVVDTGIGIHKDKLPLIFDKFTQADEAITRKFGGTGLGLYITKRLANLMGGSITVRSELGKGSCFTLHVPFRIAQNLEPVTIKEKRDEPLPALPEGRYPIECIKALVAEDHEMNIIFIKKLLKTLNLNNYDIAKNGAEALAMFQSGTYDLVLMDCHMPELSGYECTTEIRKLENSRKTGAHVPIVAITADAMIGTREKCLAAGMDDYISKPIDKQKFKDILSRWFILGAN